MALKSLTGDAKFLAPSGEALQERLMTSQRSARAHVCTDSGGHTKCARQMSMAPEVRDRCLWHQNHWTNVYDEQQSPPRTMKMLSMHRQRRSNHMLGQLSVASAGAYPGP